MIENVESKLVVLLNIFDPRATGPMGSIQYNQERVWGIQLGYAFRVKDLFKLRVF